MGALGVVPNLIWKVDLMADRPIIFSAPMILALLAGRKTQTRRRLKPAPFEVDGDWYVRHRGDEMRLDTWTGDQCGVFPWLTGDRLWVRENHVIVPRTAYRASEGVQQIRSPEDPDDAAIYAAGWERSKPRWRPSIHMPRWASRLTLLVGEVRVQRLLDITEEDAEAEGVCHFVEEGHGAGSFRGLHGADRTALVCSVYGSSRIAFRHLWETLNGAEAWNANPWVAAVSFTVHRANIDALDIAARAA